MARQLIGEFGDPKLLAVLCRRAKKRCWPLWFKVLVRSVQSLSVLILYCVLCSLPLFVGKPTVKVDYAQWLSERWRPSQKGVENAKQYYDQAAKLYVKPPAALETRRELPGWTIRDCNEADFQSLTDWLAENKPALDLVRKGAATAHYWPVYDVNEEQKAPFLWMAVNVVPEAMKTISGYESIAHAMRDWVARQVRVGAVDEAIGDALVILRFARHLEGKGLVLDQLVARRIGELGRDAVYGLLRKPDISNEILQRVQSGLDSLFAGDRTLISLDGEKASFYDDIQRTFTDDGHGGGRALRYGFFFAAGDWRGNLARMLLFDYPDRREAMTMVDAYFEQVQAALGKPLGEAGFFPGEGAAIQMQKLGLLISTVSPAYEGLSQLVWQSRTEEAALVATVAIHRCKAERGTYPDRLEDLVAAGLLASVPDDPFGKGPLTYARTADGFTLHSWGKNRADDGVRRGTSTNGEPKMWADKGDTVFWPVGP